MFVSTIKYLLISFLITSQVYTSVNESPVKKIRAILASDNVTPQLPQLHSNLSRLKPSPGDSKGTVSCRVGQALIGAVTDSGHKDPRFVRNPLANPQNASESADLDVLEAAFMSSGSKKSKEKLSIAASAAEVGGEDVRNQLSIIDYTHCQRPASKRDSSGELKRVLGGHNFDEYASGSLEGTYFEGPQKALGVYVEQAVPKTVCKKFNVGFIKEIMTQCRVVAKDGELEICESGNNGFFGKFYNKKIPLVVPSVFPLIVVRDQLSEPGDIKLGEIGRINSDHAKIFCSDVICSREDFNSMIREGVFIVSNSEYHSNVVNISEPVQKYIEALYGRDQNLKTNTFFTIYALVKKVS